MVSIIKNTFLPLPPNKQPLRPLSPIPIPILVTPQSLSTKSEPRPFTRSLPYTFHTCNPLHTHTQLDSPGTLLSTRRRRLGSLALSTRFPLSCGCARRAPAVPAARGRRSLAPTGEPVAPLASRAAAQIFVRCLAAGGDGGFFISDTV